MMQVQILIISLTIKTFSCFQNTKHFSFFNIEERNYQEDEKVKDINMISPAGYGYKNRKQNIVKEKSVDQAPNVLPFLDNIDETAVGM